MDFFVTFNVSFVEDLIFDNETVFHHFDFEKCLNFPFSCKSFYMSLNMQVIYLMEVPVSVKFLLYFIKCYKFSWRKILNLYNRQSECQSVENKM